MISFACATKESVFFLFFLKKMLYEKSHMLHLPAGHLMREVKLCCFFSAFCTKNCPTCCFVHSVKLFVAKQLLKERTPLDYCSFSYIC